MEGYLQERPLAEADQPAAAWSDARWVVIKRKQLLYVAAPVATLRRARSKSELQLVDKSLENAPVDLRKMIKVTDLDPTSMNFVVTYSTTVPEFRDPNDETPEEADEADEARETEHEDGRDGADDSREEHGDGHEDEEDEEEEDEEEDGDEHEEDEEDEQKEDEDEEEETRRPDDGGHLDGGGTDPDGVEDEAQEADERPASSSKHRHKKKRKKNRADDDSESSASSLSSEGRQATQRALAAIETASAAPTVDTSRKYPGLRNVRRPYSVEYRARTPKEKATWMACLQVFDKVGYERSQPPSVGPELLAEAGLAEADWPVTTIDLPACCFRAMELLLDHLETFAVQTRLVFRLPGASTDIRLLIKKLLSASAEFVPPELDVAVVADALKTLLRRMPESLLTDALWGRFLDASGAENYKRVSALIQLLPAKNREVLSRLAALCEMIAQNHDDTHMDMDSLAVVIGPVLLPDDTPDELRRIKDYMGAFFSALTAHVNFRYHPELLELAATRSIKQGLNENYESEEMAANQAAAERVSVVDVPIEETEEVLRATNKWYRPPPEAPAKPTRTGIRGFFARIFSTGEEERKPTLREMAGLPDPDIHDHERRGIFHNAALAGLVPVGLSVAKYENAREDRSKMAGAVVYRAPDFRPYEYAVTMAPFGQLAQFSSDPALADNPPALPQEELDVEEALQAGGARNQIFHEEIKPYVARAREPVRGPVFSSPLLAGPALAAVLVGSRLGVVARNHRTSNALLPSPAACVTGGRKHRAGKRGSSVAAETVGVLPGKTAAAHAAAGGSGPRTGADAVAEPAEADDEVYLEPAPYVGPDLSQAQALRIWHGIQALRLRIRHMEREEIRLEGVVARCRFAAEWEATHTEPVDAAELERMMAQHHTLKIDRGTDPIGEYEVDLKRYEDEILVSGGLLVGGGPVGQDGDSDGASSSDVAPSADWRAQRRRGLLLLGGARGGGRPAAAEMVGRAAGSASDSDSTGSSGGDDENDKGGGAAAAAAIAAAAATGVVNRRPPQRDESDSDESTDHEAARFEDADVVEMAQTRGAPPEVGVLDLKDLVGADPPSASDEPPPLLPAGAVPASRGPGAQQPAARQQRGGYLSGSDESGASDGSFTSDEDDDSEYDDGQFEDEDARDGLVPVARARAARLNEFLAEQEAESRNVVTSQKHEQDVRLEVLRRQRSLASMENEQQQRERQESEARQARERELSNIMRRTSVDRPGAEGGDAGGGLYGDAPRYVRVAPGMDPLTLTAAGRAGQPEPGPAVSAGPATGAADGSGVDRRPSGTAAAAARSESTSDLSAMSGRGSAPTGLASSATGMATETMLKDASILEQFIMRKRQAHEERERRRLQAETDARLRAEEDAAMRARIAREQAEQQRENEERAKQRELRRRERARQYSEYGLPRKREYEGYLAILRAHQSELNDARLQVLRYIKDLEALIDGAGDTWKADEVVAAQPAA